jgi:hypothetical protein
MTLRAELIALTVNQRMDETIRGPIEVADDYLRVFAEYMTTGEGAAHMEDAMMEYRYDECSASKAIDSFVNASLTEASE